MFFKSFVAGTILAILSTWITFRLSLVYIIRHPQHDAMEGLQAVFNAIVVGFLVEVVGCVLLFVCLQRRSSKKLELNP